MSHSTLITTNPWTPNPKHEHALAQVIRATLKHREQLLADDPWLPLPQNACSFAFGEDNQPLPIAAAFILWGQWPAFTGVCACGGAIYGFGFGGLLSAGGVFGVCLDCGLKHFNSIGGLGTVASLVKPYLVGTPYYLHNGLFGGCYEGPRQPLWDKLRALGVLDLPKRGWCGGHYPEAASLVVKTAGRRRR